MKIPSNHKVWEQYIYNKNYYVTSPENDRSRYTVWVGIIEFGDKGKIVKSDLEKLFTSDNPLKIQEKLKAEYLFI